MKKQEDRLHYIEEMAAELAKMARSEGSVDLACVLEMAVLEAQTRNGNDDNGKRR